MEDKKGSYKMWFDKELNVITLRVVGILDEKIATDISKKLFKLLDSFPIKKDVLLDLSESDNPPKPSSKARKIFSEMIKHKKIRKMATFGGGAIQRVTSQFIINVSGIKNTKVFNKKEDALKWLNEK